MMARQTDTARYGSLTIGVHWFMLVLLVAVYACMELREIFPKGSDPREAMKTWHAMLGLSVLVLAVLRLIISLAGQVPPIHPTPSRWQRMLAHLMKAALYGLMIGMPIAGWLLLSASAKPIPFFGLQLAPLIGASTATAELIKEIHETGATAGYFLIGLHAGAALFHHYWLGDNTLRRMLPRRP